MREQHFGQVVPKAITGDRAVGRARGAEGVTDVGDVGIAAKGARGAVGRTRRSRDRIADSATEAPVSIWEDERRG
ncbi:MAG: hypothetical protein QOG75_3818 [Mycobacterium sp.]|nr:hypothetical protein [Mycobacterium sp.]